jgi:exosortase/archaeosortase family protein
MLRFVLGFCILYYGTIAFIGIASPGGYYIEWLDRHLNFVSWLRAALLQCSRGMMLLLGYDVYLKDVYTIRVIKGAGVHVGYDCIGYGVLYFWIAFIYANQVGWKKQVKWLLGGVALIFTVNIARITLLLLAVNKKIPTVGNWDNHTLFNIAAYLVIFTMIYFFDRTLKNEKQNQLK